MTTHRLKNIRRDDKSTKRCRQVIEHQIALLSSCFKRDSEIPGKLQTVCGIIREEKLHSNVSDSVFLLQTVASSNQN